MELVITNVFGHNKHKNTVHTAENTTLLHATVFVGLLYLKPQQIHSPIENVTCAF